MKLNVDDLIERGLVQKKTYTEGVYKGLSVLKYKKKVFYDNLWHLDERLLECRGTIVDEDDNVVVLPFRKVFNIGENNTKVHRDLPIQYIEKKNGFMLAVTKTEKYGVIVSTTGSLDSKYVELGKGYVEKYIDTDELHYNNTYIFEVCDPSDPHIVDEDFNIYLIGVRNTENGYLWMEAVCDYSAFQLSINRPQWNIGLIGDIPPTKQEGYMIRDSETHEVLTKAKSKFYSAKKCLMRLGRSKVDIMYDNTREFKKRLDEEFYEVLDFIVNTIDRETWRGYSDQQRREVIEEYFDEQENLIAS